MKSKLLTLGMCAVLILGNVGIVAAQQIATDNWSAVRALAVDEKLIVKQKHGMTIEGKMIEATDQNLILDRHGKSFTVARPDIQQIFRSIGKAKKAKWGLIGTGVGAAVGTGLGTAASQGSDNNEKWFPIGVLLGTGIGAVTGVLFGSSRGKRELIYQAP